MSLPTIMNTYGRLPVTFIRGNGVYLYDAQNNEYLDAISGIGVNALGHAHPAVSNAIKQQADQLLHTSNLYGITHQQGLADSLCAVSGMDSVFFCNSGAEANEAAIKIARFSGHQRGIETPTIVVMENAFHGRTMATLTASGNRKIQAGFEPLLNGFVRAPFGDITALQNIANNNTDVVAVMVEPIQGEGGVNIPPESFLLELRKLCDASNWMLMLDEVQTGHGRTGSYFAYQNCGIEPDIVTTAKGLGNGLPIGACLAKGQAASTLGPGNHGSTFGGNPLVCATGQAVVDTISNEKLCENASTMGQLLLDRFNAELSGLRCVKDIRGRGLMIGIELEQPCTELVDLARTKGLLINVTAQTVLRLLPPLIIDRQQTTFIADTIIQLINDFSSQ